MPGWARLAELPTLLALHSACWLYAIGEAETNNVFEPSRLQFQRAAAGIWEFPEAWLSEGSQLFIGHLWPLLQV